MKEMYIIEDLVHGGTWIFEDLAQVMKFIEEYVIGDAEFSIKRENVGICVERGFDV